MQSDQERLDGLMARAREASQRQVQELEEKVLALRTKINALLDERGGVLNSPFTVAETLEVAKAALQEGRKKYFLNELLVKHLQKIQIRKDNPFFPVTIRMDFLGDLDHFKLVYNMIDEFDLTEAAKSLDNGGMPKAEREAKVDAINKKVKALESEIEKLLS